jgi:hypothetical protein
MLITADGAQAADWPPLPPEDLKMTSVAEQPGAAAIVLLRDEVANDPMNFHQTYLRIKILTEEGRKYADVEVPYSRRNFHLEDVSGRTVHADGTVLPFDGRVFDKQVLRTREKAGRGEHINVKSFTLPDVQVGSVIEYRYILRYDDSSFYAPHWDVQGELFQRKATFKFIPYEGLLKMDHDRVGNGVAWTSYLPKGTVPQQHTFATGAFGGSPRAARQLVDLEITNVSPLVQEPYMPPPAVMRYRVDFYYMLASKQEEYWKDEGKFWNKDVENFLGKKNGIDAAVRQVTAGGDSPEQKLRNIYGVVGGLDNWSYQPARAVQQDKALGIKQNSGAEDVLRQHGGTHDDLNRLFVAMARAAGMSAYLMRVPSRDRELFDPALLSTRQFAAEIAIVQLNGKEVFLDPGTKFCPYGLLDWRYTNVRGLRQSAGGKGTELVATPSVDYTKTQVQRLARLKLNEDGKAEGMVKVGFYGQEQMDFRQEGGKTDAEGRRRLLEDELKRWLPGDSEVTLTDTPDWESTEPHLAAEFKISTPLAVASGKRWIVPVHIFQVNEKPWFAASQRINPVYFDYEFSELDEVHLALPDGMEVESLPGNDSVRTDFAVYNTAQGQDADKSVVARRGLVLGGLLFPTTVYGEVKGFFEKVKTGDDQPLLLKGAAHAELK